MRKILITVGLAGMLATGCGVDQAPAPVTVPTHGDPAAYQACLLNATLQHLNRTPSGDWRDSLTTPPGNIWCHIEHGGTN